MYRYYDSYFFLLPCISIQQMCEIVYLFVCVFVHVSLQSTIYMSEVYHSAIYIRAFWVLDFYVSLMWKSAFKF